MTPFDVVKTRLQTQGSPESLFIPSSHVPPPTQSASASFSISSIPSSLKGKGKAVPQWQQPPSATNVTPLQHARSLAATNLATCCQKTYFTNNLAEKNAILCRFDPRKDAGSSSGGGGSSGSGSSGSRNIGKAMASSSNSSSSSSALKGQIQASAGTTAAMPRRAASYIPFSSMTSGGGSGGGAAVLSAEACLYPTPNIAAQHLPQLTLPSSRHFAGFVDAITKIVRYEGAPALWRGLSPSLVMSVPSQVIYMVGYDTLRTLALEKPPARFVTSGAGSEGGRHGQGQGQPSRAYIASTTFAAGSVSRTGVAVLLAPLELFRTRLQSTVGRDVSLRSVVSSVGDLVRVEGYSSLWRGLSATLWRDVPFSGAYWAGYEAIRRVLSGGKGMGEVTVGEKAGKTFAVAFASGSGSGMVRRHFFLILVSTARGPDAGIQANLYMPVRILRSQRFSRTPLTSSKRAVRQRPHPLQVVGHSGCSSSSGAEKGLQVYGEAWFLASPRLLPLVAS